MDYTPKLLKAQLSGWSRQLPWNETEISKKICSWQPNSLGLVPVPRSPVIIDTRQKPAYTFMESKKKAQKGERLAN